MDNLKKDQIKQLINDNIEQLSDKWLNSSSDNIEIFCHNCTNPRNRNLSISLTKEIYHCWACGASGSLYKLFKLRGKSGLEQFKKISTYKGNDTEIIEKEPEKAKIITIPENCIHISEFESDPRFEIFSMYLYNDRFLTRELLYEYNFYFDIKERRFYVYSYNNNGGIDFSVSRNIQEKAYYILTGDKKKIIFNEFMINWKKPVFLVEGLFDAIRLENSIPLFGMELNDSFALFNKILLEKANVFIIFDNESGATKNAIKIAEKLKEKDDKLKIYIGEIKDEEFKDIGKMEEILSENFDFFEYNLLYTVMKS